MIFDTFSYMCLRPNPIKIYTNIEPDVNPSNTTG